MPLIQLAQGCAAGGDCGLNSWCPRWPTQGTPKGTGPPGGPFREAQPTAQGLGGAESPLPPECPQHHASLVLPD